MSFAVLFIHDDCRTCSDVVDEVSDVVDKMSEIIDIY